MFFLLWKSLEARVFLSLSVALRAPLQTSSPEPGSSAAGRGAPTLPGFPALALRMVLKAHECQKCPAAALGSVAVLHDPWKYETVLLELHGYVRLSYCWNTQAGAKLSHWGMASQRDTRYQLRTDTHKTPRLVCATAPGQGCKRDFVAQHYPKSTGKWWKKHPEHHLLTNFTSCLIYTFSQSLCFRKSGEKNKNKNFYFFLVILCYMWKRRRRLRGCRDVIKKRENRSELDMVASSS